MSLSAMPLIVANLGCEMLYILDQRLKAQNIPGDKSSKVLHDVIGTMFNRGFVQELFKPQAVYSVSATRKIFDKLAHSSIMRLSESSMDKLFDLMMMGVKYQLQASTSPSGMLDVTLAHLDCVGQRVDAKDSKELLNACADRVRKHYGSYLPEEWNHVRHTLANYFQDKRVKVSLFLQEGIQTREGRIILPYPEPVSGMKMGAVEHYSPTGAVTKSTTLSCAAQSISRDEFFCHPIKLGLNLYDKARPRVTPPPRKLSVGMDPNKSSSSSRSGQSGAGLGAMPSMERMKPAAEVNKLYAEDMLSKTSSTVASAALNTLADLIAAPKATDNFKLNLFNDDGVADVAPGPGAEMRCPTIDATTHRDNAHLAGLMSEMDVGDSAGGDDLLELMDEAAAK